MLKAKVQLAAKCYWSLFFIFGVKEECICPVNFSRVFTPQKHKHRLRLSYPSRVETLPKDTFTYWRLLLKPTKTRTSFFMLVNSSHATGRWWQGDRQVTALLKRYSQQACIFVWARIITVCVFRICHITFSCRGTLNTPKEIRKSACINNKGYFTLTLGKLTFPNWW